MDSVVSMSWIGTSETERTRSCVVFVSRDSTAIRQLAVRRKLIEDGESDSL